MDWAQWLVMPAATPKAPAALFLACATVVRHFGPFVT